MASNKDFSNNIDIKITPVWFEENVCCVISSYELILSAAKFGEIL